MFDHYKILVKAGKGGDGAIAFRHEKSIAKGGPYGGNGGDGGSVYFRASKDIESLQEFSFRQHFFAQDGENGKSKLCNGRNGKDIVIAVPVGTIVTNEDGNFVADLDKDGEMILIAKGGRGGRGNASFKSSTRRTPNLAENGLEGEKKNLFLELRLLADVGLAGFPNAGKSSLISSITNAKSLVASYQFSTLEPVLGVCDHPYLQERFVIADIPGLIEGASHGKGMGFDFLRHILRCRVIAHCIDPTDCEHGNLQTAYNIINSEIDAYSQEFSRKRHVVIITKMDLVEERSAIDSFVKTLPSDIPVFFVSCLDDQSLASLAKGLSSIVAEERNKKRTMWSEQTGKEVVYSANDFDTGSIPQYDILPMEDGKFVIQGDRVIRMKRLINLSTDEGLDRLIAYLDRIGVNERLKDMNVPAGATVVLDDFEFEYQP